MQDSINSRFFSSSSKSKIYFIKKGKMKQFISKQTKDFFTNPLNNYQQLHSQNLQTYPSLSSINSNLNLKSQIKSQEDFKSQNFEHTSQALTSLLESRTKNPIKLNTLNRQSSVSHDRSYKNRLKKKYIFQTICDSNFNKSLKRSQILIENQNPELSTIQYDQQSQSKLRTKQFGLPKLELKSKELYNKKHFLTPNNSYSHCLDKKNKQFFQKSFHMDDPLYKIQKQLGDKLNMQKLKQYHKLWHNKSKKRLQMLTLSKRDLPYNKSLLQKSLQKSKSISCKYNKDIDYKKSIQKFQDTLRGNSRSYVTIGEPVKNIGTLKGKNKELLEQETLKQIEVTIFEPNVKNNSKKFIKCEQMYKFDNERIRKREKIERNKYQQGKKLI